MAKVVLAYHMWRIESWDRTGADLLSLRADLDVITRSGIPVVSLDDLLSSRCSAGVAITFDDGTRMDAEPITHSRWGDIPSALSVLSEFAESPPRWKAASFVIGSPEARAAIALPLAADYGPDLLHDRWWRRAAMSGLLTIENHSWDHNHELVSKTLQRNNERGTFANVDHFDECHLEIALASEYIAERVGSRPRFFAYPYGESSTYMRETFLPAHGAGLGIEAALATDPRVIAGDQNRWCIPRFVAGRDWTTDDGLKSILGL